MLHHPKTVKYRPKIALAIPDYKPWGTTSFLNGVNEYASPRHWLLTSCPVDPESANEFPLNWSRLKSWQVDGIILEANKPEHLKQLTKLRIPMVNLGADLIFDYNIPRLISNDLQIGKLAAEYLIGLGLRHLAYHGVKGRWYSEQRLEGFKQTAAAAQIKTNIFCMPHVLRDAFWNEHQETIKRWLKTLSLPCGIFAIYDYRALIVLSACREIGLRVPEDVSVIGCDNDLLVCEFSEPKLTSVCVNAHKMGYEAAKLLDNLMRGKKLPPEPILIDPTGIVSRASTDVMHINDPVVNKAVQFFRQNYPKSFKMSSVAEAVGVSRRLLEMRFHADRKTSPAKFLAHLRLQKAKIMLASNYLNMRTKDVALACGFGSEKNMCLVMHRILNATPKDFISKFRERPPRINGTQCL